jgi:hypothetical protein
MRIAPRFFALVCARETLYRADEGSGRGSSTGYFRNQASGPFRCSGIANSSRKGDPHVGKVLTQNVTRARCCDLKRRLVLSGDFDRLANRVPTYSEDQRRSGYSFRRASMSQAEEPSYGSQCVDVRRSCLNSS